MVSVLIRVQRYAHFVFIFLFHTIFLNIFSYQSASPKHSLPLQPKIIATLSQNSSLIYGHHPVADALRNGNPIDKVYVQQGTRGELEREMRLLCRERDVPMMFVPKEKLDRWVQSSRHQGVIAVAALLPYYKLADVLATVYERQEMPLILLLDGITDVRNFGAIARSAVCAGVQALVIPEKGSALINEEAMKASAGALSNIPVCRETSIFNAVEQLQLNGFQVFAGDLSAKKYVFELDLDVPTAFIIGAEGEGVSPTLLRKSDERFKIPQTNGTDSFNVSVATGIMLYEVTRQRMK